MKKYEVMFNNNLTGESIEVHQVERPRLTKSEYDNVLLCLFSYAAESIAYKSLTATIYADGVKLHTIDCETTVDGSTITAHIYGDGKYIRDMVIAA